MRKISKLLFAVSIFMLTFAPAAFSNENPTENPSKAREKTLSEEEIKHLENRLTEIKEMDKSKLTKAEKKELRREVKEIKKTMASGPFIYISASAILIILLLVLLLR